MKLKAQPTPPPPWGVKKYPPPWVFKPWDDDFEEQRNLDGGKDDLAALLEGLSNSDATTLRDDIARLISEGFASTPDVKPHPVEGIIDTSRERGVGTERPLAPTDYPPLHVLPDPPAPRQPHGRLITPLPEMAEEDEDETYV